MTDATPPLHSPPSRMDAAKVFVGDLARPFAIIASSVSASAAGIIIALRVDNPDLTAASIFMGALYTGLAALYGAKAWETVKAKGAEADVSKAAINAGNPNP